MAFLASIGEVKQLGDVAVAVIQVSKINARPGFFTCCEKSTNERGNRI